MRHTSRRQRWTGLLLLAFVGSSLALPGTSAAEPTDVVVSPVVAPVGTPVEVTGAGCQGPVDLDVRGYRDPAGIVDVLRTVVQPEADGSWSAGFAMPDVAVYVAATCDGSTPVPTVVAPSGVGRNRVTPRVVGDELLLDFGPGVEGSLFELRTEAGELVAAAMVVGGDARISVPRSRGPVDLVALLLRPVSPDGIDLPWFPEVVTLAVPPPVSPLLLVSPRVGLTGATTTASGRCAGAVRLVVTGQPEGRGEVAPTFLDRAVPVRAGAWSVQFAMPAEPSDVTASCTTGGTGEEASAIIAPTDAHPVESLGFPKPDGTGFLLSSSCVGGPLEAFTADGRTAPLKPFDEDWLEVPVARPGTFYVLGEEFFPGYGDDLVDSRPQVCVFRLPGAAVAPPTATPPAAAPGATVRPAAAAPVVQPAAPELPATGAAPLTGWAAGLVLAGAVLLLASRPHRPRPSR